jgi:hypothetical protein
MNQQQLDEIRERAEFWPPSIMDQSLHLEVVRADTLALLAEIERLRTVLERIGRAHWKAYKPEAAQEEIRKVVDAALKLD